MAFVIRGRADAWSFDVTTSTNILSSTLALLRDTPRPARIGLALFFVAGLADGVLIPFFALWAQQDAGIATEYIGLLFGCYAGGELVATPLVGGIADRIGRRPTLLISTAGVGLGFLLLYFTRGALAAAAALLLIGMFESVLHPTAATVIADTVPADRLRRYFSLTRMMSNAGSMIGPALGALLALWSLGLVFVGAGACLLIGAGIVAIGLSETRQRTGEADDDDDGLVALTAAFRDRRLGFLLLPVAVMEIALSWIEAVTPLYANNAGTLTPSGVGLLFTYAGALGVLFQLPVTEASSRMSGSKIVLMAGAAQALAFACLLSSTALPLLVAAVSFLALSGMLVRPLTQVIVTELAPANARATYLAAFAAVGDFKDTIGPATGVYLYAVAATLPWLVGLPAAALATLALAAVARRHEGRG
jgi:MFS family permease